MTSWWGWMEGAGGDGEGSDDKDAAKKKTKGWDFPAGSSEKSKMQEKRRWCWLLFGCGGLCCSPPPWRGPHGQALSPLIKLCHHKRRRIPTPGIPPVAQTAAIAPSAPGH